MSTSMGSKIGSPFELNGVKWDGETASYNPPIPITGAVNAFAKAAIEAWTPKPPEGWEEYPEEVELPYYPDGMLNPNTGHVHPLQEGKYYLLLGHSEQPNAMDAIGFVPVRKVRPAVPEWVEPFVYALMEQGDHERWVEYVAKHCVPKADADEMLAALKRVGHGITPSELKTLIERMEGK